MHLSDHTTDSRQLRILLLGDASNYHNTLAIGLRRAGHDVTVASDGTQWMDTARDIDLSRRPGKVGGLNLWLKMRWTDRKQLSGYDVVSIAGTHFAQLRPERLTSIFDYVKRNNRSVFQSALATDSFFIDECFDRNSPIKYNEWFVNGHPTEHFRHNLSIASAWSHGSLRNYCNHIAANIDGAVTALYEYDISCRRALPHDRIAYGGIPIDMSAIKFAPVPEHIGKIRLFLGFPEARKLEKGAERLLATAQRVAAAYPDRCELDVVSNVPLREFTERLNRAHVVIDQLYSYSPATTALMAMAMGKTVLSGAEPEFYDFIGEPSLHPIINLRPDDEAIYNAIEHCVLHPETLSERSYSGRQFVRRHNDCAVVAQRFLDLWTRRLAEKERRMV